MADGIRHAVERGFATGSGRSGNESSDPAHGFSVAAIVEQGHALPEVLWSTGATCGGPRQGMALPHKRDNPHIRPHTADR